MNNDEILELVKNRLEMIDNGIISTTNYLIELNGHRMMASSLLRLYLEKKED